MNQTDQISAFSNGRELTLEEIQIAHTIIDLPPSNEEPSIIRDYRTSVRNAYLTSLHLNKVGHFPIIDAFSYLVMKKKGIIK